MTLSNAGTTLRQVFIKLAVTLKANNGHRPSKVDSPRLGNCVAKQLSLSTIVLLMRFVPGHA